MSSTRQSTSTTYPFLTKAETLATAIRFAESFNFRIIIFNLNQIANKLLEIAFIKDLNDPSGVRDSVVERIMSRWFSMAARHTSKSLRGKRSTPGSLALSRLTYTCKSLLAATKFMAKNQRLSLSFNRNADIHFLILTTLDSIDIVIRSYDLETASEESQSLLLTDPIPKKGDQPFSQSEHSLMDEEFSMSMGSSNRSANPFFKTDKK